MGKSLLLISSRPEDHAFAAQVAKTAELTFQTAADAKIGMGIILQENPAVILIDASTEKIYQKFEQEVQDSVGLFSDKISANTMHFISSEDLERVQYLIQSPLFGHFITRSYGDPAEAGLHYGRVVRNLFAKRAFGLNLLLSDKAKIQTVKLDASHQKIDAVEAVRSFAAKAKFQPRMATVIANAVDEILMNAIFDAPIDELGRPLYKVTARSSKIKLEGKSQVEMNVGFDGRYLAVSACDNYGSLEKAALLSHISKIYTNEDYKVKSTVAGAGIGLATVYHSGGSLLFVSESRVRTEVTVLFSRLENFRDFKNQFRFISTQFYF